MDVQAKLRDLQLDYASKHTDREARIGKGEITREEVQQEKIVAYNEFLINQYKITKNVNDVRFFLDMFRSAYMKVQAKFLDGQLDEDTYHKEKMRVFREFETPLVKKILNFITDKNAKIFFDNCLEIEKEYIDDKITRDEMCRRNEVLFIQYVDEYLMK